MTQDRLGGDRTRAYVGAFDGLRTIAVVAVLVYHLNGQWLPGGFMGVDVFLVLSGYLITSILLRTTQRREKPWLGQFWLRRFRRLIPALYLMIILVTAISVFAGPDLRVLLGRQLAGALTYSSNWVYIFGDQSYFERDVPGMFLHLWSLAVEEQFYLVWPIIFGVLLLLVKSCGVRTGVLVGLAVLSAWWMAWLFVPGTDPSRVYYGTDTHAFGLMLGSALAVAFPLTEGTLERVQRWRVDRLNAAGLVLFGGLIALLVLLPDDADFTYRGGLFLLSLVTCLLLVVLLHEQTWVSRLLRLSPLVWVGKRSYGIYLWHWPMMLLVSYWVGANARQWWGTAIVVVVTVVATLVASALSYRWVEKPIMAHGLRAYFRSLRFPTGQVARWGSGAQRSPVFRRATVTGMAVAVTVLCLVAITTFPRSTTVQHEIERGLADIQQAQADRVGAAMTAPSSAAASPSPAASASPAASPAPSASASEPPPTVGEPGFGPVVIDGDQVIAAGDSVMIASAGALQEQYPGITIQAKVARQATGTLKAATSLLKKHPDARLIVLHVGTNGTFTQGDVEKFIDSAGSDRGIVLVNVFADRSWEKKNNAKLKKLAEAHPNVSVADWHTAISENTKHLAGDLIHPNPKGGEVYADAVTNAAASLGLITGEQ